MLFAPSSENENRKLKNNDINVIISFQRRIWEEEEEEKKYSGLEMMIFINNVLYSMSVWIR